jgi:hypothetical protein
MIRQNCKINELDGKAAAVLAAGRLTDEEVERIASGPHLMASVWARIEAEKAASFAEPIAETGKPFIFDWWAAFAAMAFLIVIAGGTAVYLRTGNKLPVVAKAPEQNFQNRTSIATPTIGYPESASHAAVPKQNRPHFERAAFRPAAGKVHPVRRTSQASLPPPPPLEFYTLPAVQDTAEAVKDARIVTVELPRASLVALGANIPLEGDKQLVKADLLVGPDGVPRAIRLAD